jgi:hypothetical protein
MAGLLSPFKADKRLESQGRSQLDSLYQRVIDDLDTLVQAVGLKAPDFNLKREQIPRYRHNNSKKPPQTVPLRGVHFNERYWAVG